MSRDDTAILDILKAARLVIEFVAHEERTGFENDLKTQSAVLHQLLIIGEAAKRLSDSFRNAHPEIPWKQMAGMRDKLIHGYDIVDIEEVWNTVENDLPEIIHKLEKMSKSE